MRRRRSVTSRESESRAAVQPASSSRGAGSLNSNAVFVCAHGAGGHKDDKSMLRLAGCLESVGIEVLRFDFPYRAAGSRRPDPMPVLQAAIREEAERARAALKGRKLLLGGRSMGGRAASMLAAEGYPCDGLLLAAYPLHPAGKPEKLRDAHLGAIRCPVLCLNGTRDALCERALMEKALEKVTAPWTMHWLEGADHSFNVLKSSGRTAAQVDAEVGEAARRWFENL